MNKTNASFRYFEAVEPNPLASVGEHYAKRFFLHMVARAVKSLMEQDPGMGPENSLVWGATMKGANLLTPIFLWR